MKMLCCLLISVAAGCLLSGCGESKSESPPPSSSKATNASSGGSLLTAPVDYLNAAAKGEQSAIKTVDTTSINKAIDLFNVDKGRFPKDLNELVAEKYLPEIPPVPHGTMLVYDANAGKVTVAKQE
jgi:hypothetical protein